MLRKSKWLLVPAAALAAASLMVSGCFGKTSEHELQEAADAINAAIEHDLALDRYEFTVSRGALFDEKSYEGQKTTYICVSGDGGRDYYVTTTSSDKSSTLTVEHELLGDDHYLTRRKTSSISPPMPAVIRAVIPGCWRKAGFTTPPTAPPETKTIKSACGSTGTASLRKTLQKLPSIRMAAGPRFRSAAAPNSLRNLPFPLRSCTTKRWTGISGNWLKMT